MLHQATTGRDINIAIIDTGADTQHLEFRGAKIRSLNTVDRNRGEYQRDTHGTAVLGLISAQPDNREGIVGLAPGASIAMIKACWYPERSRGGKAVCNSLTLSAALDAAIQSQADIINMSLSGPPDALVARLVQKAIEQGIVIVASDPLIGRSRYPALLPNVIAVSSAISEDNQVLDQQSFSINIVASDTLSTSPGGNYDFYSGASISTAIASALLANSMEQLPDMALAERTARLESTLPKIGFVSHRDANK